MVNLTPMMQQYNSIKNRHKDALLFFRMGDFYELFNDDAKEASKVLGITLTSRSKSENATPMAGIPHHAADSYISRLIKEGYKVAICEQISDPKDKEAKGIVERDVTRVVTPGTVTEDVLLDGKSHNYLVSVLIKDGKAGLSWVDLSTGRFEVEDIGKDQLLDELNRINPSECLLSESCEKEASILSGGAIGEIVSMVSTRPDWEFACDNGYKTLTEHFGTTSLVGFDCEDLELALGAAGAIILYLKETQKASLPHIRKINRFSCREFLVMDRPTQYSLELTETMRTSEKAGSLLEILDRTETPMGGRLLKEWTMTPLKNVEMIKARQGGVKELFDNILFRMDINKVLSHVYDIERIAVKVSCERANPRDLVSLKHSLNLLPQLKDTLSLCGSALIKTLHEGLDVVEEARVAIGAAIVESPPLNIKDGGVIREGYSNDLDELRNASKDGKGWIANFQADEVERTGISSLKVGYNRVFGYYIEVTNLHKDKVPESYVRKQTLKNAERYITSDLKKYESMVLTAEERSKELELEIFQEIRETVAKFTPQLQKTANVIAHLDTICSLATVAAENGYVMPEIDGGSELNIIDGRHPVLDRKLMGEVFVANDIQLDGVESYAMIITGPNMAGKSTYIRQIALLVVMAQMGSFIPAKEAKIGIVDRIFTRIGAADELARGQSTFMVEMNEVANILNNATSRSLLILDEVGRGTSTYDGVSIAWAVIEYIYNFIKARTLFATHYHELTKLAETFPAITNHNIAVKELEDEIVFLRKIVDGGTDKSYGIHVARLAGIPETVIKRSQDIHSNFSIEPGNGGNGKASVGVTSAENRDAVSTADDKKVAAKTSKPEQLSLFDTEGHKVIDAIRNLDISNTTPLDALVKLNDLKKRLES